MTRAIDIKYIIIGWNIIIGNNKIINIKNTIYFIGLLFRFQTMNMSYDRYTVLDKNIMFVNVYEL